MISRSLGAGNREKARSTAAFIIRTAIAVLLLYSILLVVFRPYILPAIGTNAGTYDYCYQYAFWTVTIGAIPTVLNAQFAHQVAL